MTLTTSTKQIIKYASFNYETIRRFLFLYKLFMKKAFWHTQFILLVKWNVSGKDKSSFSHVLIFGRSKAESGEE